MNQVLKNELIDAISMLRDLLCSICGFIMLDEIAGSSLATVLFPDIYLVYSALSVGSILLSAIGHASLGMPFYPFQNMFVFCAPHILSLWGVITWPMSPHAYVVLLVVAIILRIHFAEELRLKPL